jgi:O-antigen/teichoic acid export membrane protein
MGATNLTNSPAFQVQEKKSVSIWRSVRGDAALLGAGTVGIVIAQLGFRSILIATLIPSAYGRLSLILSIYNTIMIVGASGLPNGAARYIAGSSPADDPTIVRSAIRAGVWPTVVAAIIVGAASGVILNTPLACFLGIFGLSSLVYSLLATGILRGRGNLLAAASLMPIAAFLEVGLLAAVWRSGMNVTPLLAYGIFCLGNVLGVMVGILFVRKTAPSRWGHAIKSTTASITHIPSTRELLGFSMWLGIATVSVALIPLIMRFAAVLNSYTVVAIIDVALVFLSIPQRVGAVIVAAVIPHATKSMNENNLRSVISVREQIFMIVPFVLGAAVLAFTPVVGWIFDALGRPEYQIGADYLALALLAGPARILYGVVQGVLAAHGEARFLAFNALAISGVASGLIVATSVLGSTLMAFGIFVVACWVIYINGSIRVGQLASRIEVMQSSLRSTGL